MRNATFVEADAAMRALVAMREKNPGKQMRFADEDTAHLHLHNAVAAKRAVVVQGYFILFDIGRPWYSKEDFLIEDLIIRIERTDAPVRVAIDALSELAKGYHCVAVISGDTQIGLMAPQYLAAGFVPLGSQFIKEV